MPLTQSRPYLHYETQGETGSPVLFIMGYGMRSVFWQPQVGELSQTHRCCVYDHPGIGRSETGSMLQTTRRLAQHATRLLDELGWAEAHVVGVSMGGMVAQELTLHRQERVRSLALIATHGGGALARVPTLKGFTQFLRASLASDPNTRVAALQSLLYPPEYRARRDREGKAPTLGEQLGPRPPNRVLLAQSYAVLQHQPRARLLEIQVPTMIVRPGRDILIRPSNSDQIHRWIPHAELVSFPGAGHGVTVQEASRLNEALRRHFASADPGHAGTTSTTDRKSLDAQAAISCA